MTEQGAINSGHYLVLSYKGYNIYAKTDYDFFRFTLGIFNATNGKCILYEWCKCNDKNNIQKDVDKVIEKWKKKLFTEEDICTPCTTLQEYKNKEEFLCKIYVRNAYGSDAARFGTNMNTAVYDPVSDCFLPSGYADFVKHHVWLYVQLILSKQPSVFLDDSNLHYNKNNYLKGLFDELSWYLYTIEYIQEDELLYQGAEEKIKTLINIENFYLYLEDYDYENISMKLASDGYIVKKSILKRMLWQAQKYKNSKFEQIISEKLKEYGYDE